MLMQSFLHLFTFFFLFQYIHKVVELTPGLVGIKFLKSGKIFKLEENAQQVLRDAGITKGWKIVRIDSQNFSKNLLLNKIKGSENYEIELIKHVWVNTRL